MDENPFDLVGKEFIFEYGRVELLPFDRLRKNEFGNTIASEQKACRRERIVRCRDCEHFRPPGKPDPARCSGVFAFVEPDPDGFCAWGERKGES